MTEWAILLVLAPAIVVPVVLLFGFAGCDWVFGLTPLISIDVEANSSSTVTVRGSFDDDVESFRIEQRRGGETTTIAHDAPASLLVVANLDPATAYEFRVRGVSGDGDTSNWTNWAMVTTFPLGTTFESVLQGDEADWRGYSLVQRIEPGRLTTSGSRVQLTLRASSVGSGRSSCRPGGARGAAAIPGPVHRRPRTSNANVGWP
jgi:hypothetical protein